jgi:hypothetical protein
MQALTVSSVQVKGMATPAKPQVAVDPVLVPVVMTPEDTPVVSPVERLEGGTGEPVAIPVVSPESPEIEAPVVDCWAEIAAIPTRIKKMI